MALSSEGYGVGVVLDGVTPPASGITGCVHSVPWFTKRLGEALLRIAGERDSPALADCLDEAIARVAHAHGPNCDLTHVHTPQATVTAVRWNSERVEYLVLSDSVVLLESMDGAVTPVFETRMDDVRSKPEVRRLYEQLDGLPAGSSARLAVTGELDAIWDGLRNAQGGFYTAGGNPSVGQYAVTGSRPRAAVRSVAALTDGATRWTEVFHLGEWADLMAVLRADGCDALVNQVRLAEQADPAGEDQSGRKKHDDASVLYAAW